VYNVYNEIVTTPYVLLPYNLPIVYRLDFPCHYRVRARLPYGGSVMSNLIPSDCSHCDDSGFDHAEDNFCSCPEGDKLLQSEMSTVPNYTDVLNDDLEDPYWD